jgi:3-methyladenine DNA glycosylase AlkC
MSASNPDTPAAAPALKEMFDAARFRRTAADLAKIDPALDGKRFLTLALPGLDALSLMQRLRRMTECLRATLPSDYHQALTRLRALAPTIDKGFVTLVLPDFVGCYGLAHFEASMDALKFFTPFGSSEFAVREFLRHDLPRTLAVMRQWSLDDNEHVRRLASEGCRPRLPWSFQLQALIADPTPVQPILENLKTDPSLYVRKSVANHLNDITKNHPGRVLDLLRSWPRENPATAWIARHALRSLIKAGQPAALSLIGATGKAEVQLQGLTLTPARLQPGGSFTLSVEVISTSRKSQRLVVDCAVHYIKKSGASSRKVFKWKEVTLPAGGRQTLTRRQTIRDFTTRVHHPGRHRVEILINGAVCGETWFDLEM